MHIDQVRHTHKRITLSQKQIEQILDLYLPSHRYVRDAIIENLSLTCKLTSTVYPYTREQLFAYITAPTTTLLACQLAYVLLGGTILARHPLFKEISWNNFLDLRDNALLRFAKFDVRFKSEVVNKEPINVSIHIEKTMRFHSTVHYRMPFRIGAGITGLIHGVIFLRPS
jgi:hypothetical protein